MEYSAAAEYSKFQSAYKAMPEPMKKQLSAKASSCAYELNYRYALAKAAKALLKADQSITKEELRQAVSEIEAISSSLPQAYSQRVIPSISELKGKLQ